MPSVRFPAMRAILRWSARALCGAMPLACAVYDDQTLLPRSGSEAPSAGAAGTQAGGGAAGTGSSASGAGNPNGGSATAGNGAAATGGDDGPGGIDGGAGNDAAGGDAAGGDGGAGTHEGGGPSHGAGSGGASGGGSGGSAGNGGDASAGGSNAAGANHGGGGGHPPQGPACSDNPLTGRATWSASASHATAASPVANLIDNMTTRWSTGKPQSGDEWLQIDFGAAVTFSQVNLQQSELYGNDYPRAYAAVVSDTDQNLNGAPQVTGSGKSGVSSTILFPALVTGRYLLIKQLGSSLSWWSAVEVEVSCVDPD